MLAMQSLPCNHFSETVDVRTTQPTSLDDTYSVDGIRIKCDNDLGILDQTSVIYFRYLIKKYRRRMGDQDVCSGGLQHFLIKQKEKKRQANYEKEVNCQEQSMFEQLPVDVKLHIFSYLSAIDLCKASRVCRSWYDITEDNLLWAGLLQRGLPTWNQIGHNTNPFIYREVESDWSNKQIYLRCSPEVNQMMHQQNALFSNLTYMLRYFLPKKIPMFAMFGPGLESKTSGLVRKIMHDSDFQCMAMFPGKFDGVGGGFTLKNKSGSQFHLSVMYSASKKERERSNGNRDEWNKLMRENKDAPENEKYELVPAVQDFCKTVDGFVYVVDSSVDSPAVETGLSELLAMVSERWSSTHVPVLVLSVVPEASTSRIPCCEIVTRLNLSQLSRPWQVRDCSIDVNEGISAGFQWLSEQSQRK
ncbi:common myeloid progenitor cell proliferation [Mactra antiquata]